MVVFPSLKIRNPDGAASIMPITKERIVVGRKSEYNDVVLQPDPQTRVKRHAQCIIEFRDGKWWVEDGGSVNKTAVQRGNERRIVNEPTEIAYGDTILILGQQFDDGIKLYWQITLEEPEKTQQANDTPEMTYLEFDDADARIYRISDGVRQEITEVRPQGHKLISYMIKRNHEKGVATTLCTYEDLAQAIWGDGQDLYRASSEINRLAWELRQKIELDPQKPQLLQLVRGQGYRLLGRMRISKTTQDFKS